MHNGFFVVQHRAAPATGGAVGVRRIGHFTSFSEAVIALDAWYEAGCWQGIRNERTRDRWWRDGTRDWTGPVKLDRYESKA